MLLEDDVDGTKTELAVFAPGSTPRAPLAQERFPSANYPGLTGRGSETTTTLPH